MRKAYAKIKNLKDQQRTKRRLTIRKKIIGSTDRPRVCAVKSNKHLSVQVIDDTKAVSILSVSTFGKSKVEGACNIETAKLVGVELANRLKKQNISKIVFDRAGYKYTGVIAALVQSVRENGIQV
jgi:large subunit ribosomal protein L18